MNKKKKKRRVKTPKHNMKFSGPSMIKSIQWLDGGFMVHAVQAQSQRIALVKRIAAPKRNQPPGMKLGR